MELSSWKTSTEIPSIPESGCEWIGEVRDRLESLNWAHEDLFKIHLSLEEAVMNAIKHGNKSDPDKKVKLDCEITLSSFSVRIEDEGPGFHREDVPDPTAEENLERESGRGLAIMENFMTEVKYMGAGNIVYMEHVK